MVSQQQTPNRKVTTRQISKLKSHPLQSEVFGDLPSDEYEHLKQDLQLRGQQDPISIDAENTVIDGHQRVRALKELGYTSVLVIVRNDLDEQARDEQFILANLTRRQLGPVARARAFFALKELAQNKMASIRPSERQGDTRDQIASKLNLRLSGRQFDRCLLLLRLPVAIQNAVDAKQLPQTSAISLVKLKVREPELDTIARRIQAGENAKVVVNEFLESATKNSKQRSRGANKSVPAQAAKEQVDVVLNFLHAANVVLPLHGDDPASLTGHYEHDDGGICHLLDQIADFCKALSDSEKEASNANE